MGLVEPFPHTAGPFRDWIDRQRTESVKGPKPLR